MPIEPYTSRNQVMVTCINCGERFRIDFDNTFGVFYDNDQDVQYSWASITCPYCTNISFTFHTEDWLVRFLFQGAEIFHTEEAAPLWVVGKYRQMFGVMPTVSEKVRDAFRDKASGHHN